MHLSKIKRTINNKLVSEYVKSMNNWKKLEHKVGIISEYQLKFYIV